MQKISELKTTERKLDQVQTQLTDKEREFMRIKSQLAAVESDGLEAAVEELKKTDEFLSEDLQDQLNRLREEHQALSSTAESQKDQLVALFTANDKLRKQLEDQKELQDTTTTATETEGLKSKQEKIEKLRERLIERQQVSEDLCLDLADMDREVRPNRRSYSVSSSSEPLPKWQMGPVVDSAEWGIASRKRPHKGPKRTSRNFLDYFRAFKGSEKSKWYRGPEMLNTAMEHQS